MSTNFQCEYCNHYYASRNAYAQHVGRYIKTVICSSTEEFGEDVSSMVSSVNEMLLDNEDFSYIDELFKKKTYRQYPKFLTNLRMIKIMKVIFLLVKDQVIWRNVKTSMKFYLQVYEAVKTSMKFYLQVYEAVKTSYPQVYETMTSPKKKNNLSNKAGNAIIKFFNKHSDLPQLSPLPKNIETGRKFMNKMNISQLSYSKYCILIHNGQEYFIHYRPIKNCIENLLSNPEILKHFMFKYENSEKYAEESIPSSAFIISIILYSDATTTDTLGKNSLHPIYLSLGNIPTWRRNKEDAKQLLGYFPILSAKNKTEKESSDFKKLACKTFHDSIKFLLDPFIRVAQIPNNLGFGTLSRVYFHTSHLRFF
ncbi:hypothetical protein Glove_85g142 [Diversispora epigaea]|uniref:C2H2-type domain-containing protein n=1 Tax=Diversispora epigaea TaxID=1348612 RepID=A0A397JGP8_9GLOM|nr:hypothetical protein Glove_85g142 [Diversispora epigaea]